MPTTSVLMTTYNGERFIEEQLRSILEQTIRDGELIIVDDCSTDTTIQKILTVLKTYSGAVSIDHVPGDDSSAHISGLVFEYLINKGWIIRLYVNEHNLGWMRNFHNGIGYVTGEIIYFADQDDIWNKNKIEIMNTAMNANPQILCLGSKCILIDSGGDELLPQDPNYEMLSYEVCGNNDNVVTKVPFTPDYISYHRDGSLQCISEKIKGVFIDGYPDTPHDILTSAVAVYLDGYYHIDSLLIHRRIHENNSTKSELSGKKAERIQDRYCRLTDLISQEGMLEQLNVFIRQTILPLDQAAVQVLLKQKQLVAKRILMLSDSHNYLYRIFRWITMLVYAINSKGVYPVRTWIMDGTTVFFPKGMLIPFSWIKFRYKRIK
jgi:glycosyltransferase involved in cell wall biosynthesis